MAEPNTSVPQTSGEESKEKLTQIRYNFTRSKSIVDELEEYYKKFDSIRAQLDDDKNGLEVNLTWSTEKKDEITQLVVDAQAKLDELKTIATSINTEIQEINEGYDEFTPLYEKVTDPTTGLDAVHTSASNYLVKIQALLTTAQTSSTSIETTITDIESKSEEVDDAYTKFTESLEKVNDPEDGLEAQLEIVKKLARDAATSKNSAETELASVISLKESATENLENIKVSKSEVDKLQKESATLTEDIRNNLDISAADSLSSAITKQRERFDKSVIWWGFGVFATIIIIGLLLGYIYYTLFVGQGDANILMKKEDAGTILVSVLSKALFASPLIFALYFTTSNFSRVKELRDNYIGKEIAAKNLQAYVKLLRSEFGDFTEKRLAFTLRNMQAIYDDPTLAKKKRRYNIGVNKIFQFDIQEEDAEQIKEGLLESAETIAESKLKSKPDNK